MLQFNPLPPSKRKNSKVPGIYKFKIHKIYEAQTSMLDKAIKLELFIEEIYYMAKYQLGINENGISHYYLENFLNSIGLLYPENGQLRLDNLKGKEGIVELILDPHTANFLIVKSFLPQYHTPPPEPSLGLFDGNIVLL